MPTTIFKRLASALFGTILLLASAAGTAAVTDSFTATYDVNYGFLGLGQTTFSLRLGEKPGCYVYSGQADPNAIVQMLVGDISDTSRFCINDTGVLRPQFFRHREEGAPEDSYTLTFDWKDSTVRYQSRAGQIKTMTLPERAVDPLSIQIAARLWLAEAQRAGKDPVSLPDRTFTLVDENEIKTYRLAVEPGPTLEVPAGRYDTVLVTRVDDDDEHLRFWLARYADWIPVRVEHEEDGRVIRMEMLTLERP